MTPFLKKEQRILLAKRRDSLPKALRAKHSADICKRLISLEEFAEAELVLLYYPIRSEIDILPVAKEAISRGKRIAFPISLPKASTLVFRCITSLSHLTEGAYGIPEPRLSYDEPYFSKTTLCVVPALAFDRSGHRLGYGKGYYDRFLSAFEGVSVGVAYSELMVDSLPTDAYDIPVNIIITETGANTL